MAYTSSLTPSAWAGQHTSFGHPVVGSLQGPIAPPPTEPDSARPPPNNPPAKPKRQRKWFFDSYDFWGEPIPVSFGKRRLPGVLVWSAPIRRIGTSKYIDFAIAVGYNLTPPSNRLDLECHYIWADGEPIYVRDWKVPTSTPIITDPCAPHAQMLPKASVTLYKGFNNQPLNGLIKKSKGDRTVGFPNMVYLVVRNLPLALLNGNHAPKFEVLLSETFTGENILYRAPYTGGTAPSVNAFAYDYGSNRGVFMNSSVSGFNNLMRVFDFDSFKEVVQVNIPPLVHSATTFIYNRGSMELDHEASLMFLSSSPNNNKPCALVNYSTGAVGPVYYNGNTLQFGFGSNSFGSFDHGEFMHGGVGPNEDVFFVSACSSSSTIGLVQVDVPTLTMLQMTSWTIPGVHTIVTSDELRDAGYAMCYLITTNGIWRLTVASGGNPGNTAQTVNMVQLADVPLVTESFYGACIDSTDFNLIIIQENASDFSAIKCDGTAWTSSPLAALPTLWTVNYATTSMERKHIKEANTRFGSLGIKGTGNNYSIIDLGSGTIINLSAVNSAYDANDPLKAAVTLGPGDTMVWDSQHSGFVLARYNTANAASTPGLLCASTDKNLNDAGVNIWEVLEWLAEAAGYDIAEIVTDITADTPSGEKATGGVITERTDVWELIRTICFTYGIDVFESEGKIKFRRQTRATSFSPAFTIANADLLSLDDESGSTIQKLVRQRSADLPKRQELNYIDSGMLYQPNTVASQRIGFPVAVTNSDSVDSTSLPLVLTSGRAKTLVNRVLFYFWEGQRNIQFRVGRKHLAIEVGDFVQLEIDQADGSHLSMRCRVREQTINEDFSTTIEAVEFSIEADYEDDDDETNILDEEVVLGPSDTDSLVIDAPHPNFSDPDDWFVFGTSFPLRSLSVTWPGAVLYRDTAVGSVPLFTTTSSLIASVGRLVTTIPAQTPWTTHEIDVTIDIVTGTNTDWVDISTAAWEAKGNLCFLGSPGVGWELVNFRDVVIVSDTQVTLSKFSRGCRGTEEQCLLDHGVGQYIVLFSTSELGQLTLPGPIGTEETFRSVAQGSDLAESRTQDITFEGNSSKPYAPVNPYIFSGSWGVDMVIKFQPQCRAEYDLQDDEDTTFVHTDPQDYKVQILSGPGGGVVRTISGLSSEQFTYTAANQATDFPGGNPRDLRVRIYQVHATHGDGFSVESRIYT